MSEILINQQKIEKKKLKDIKSFDEFDLNKVEILRGETPQHIERKCLQLCKDYLSGNWSQQTVHTIEVRRVTGGFINQIYFCGIKEADTNAGVPQEVAIRLYGKQLIETTDNSRISDIIVSIILSEKKIGPQLYGVFEGGLIQKYYKHRPFSEMEQKVPELREQVFKTLAKIHSLEVPIKVNPNWMSELLLKSYNSSCNNFSIDKEIEEYNCEVLKSFELKSEIDWIIDFTKRVESPVVFTHGDYHSNNLMITEPNDELIVCDFDVSNYSYRGFDFVNLLRCWGRNPFVRLTDSISFKEEEFKSMIEVYVEECIRIHGKSYAENPINSVEHILKEVKIFSLLHTICISIYFVSKGYTTDDFPFNRKVCMEMFENSIEYYISVKKLLKEQKIIK